MPIYEYRCEHCGVFEEMQRINDPPLSRCPTCRRKVRRLISSTSFQLKGSGWYATDYASKGGSSDASSEGAASKSADKSDSKKTESKGDSKSESKTESKTESKSKKEK